MSPVPVRIPWRARDALWAVVVGLGASIASVAFLGTDLSTAELFAVVLPAQSLGTLAAVAAMAPRREDWRVALRARVAPGDGWGILVGAGIQIVLSLVAYWVIVEVFDGTAPTQEVVEAAADAIGTAERVFVVVGLVVLGPLAEEVVFRGVLLRALERTKGPRFAILWSSVAFAALHLLDPRAIVAVPFLFVVGLVIGREVVRTGRLGRGIAIHAGFNLVTVLALLSQ